MAYTLVESFSPGKILAISRCYCSLDLETIFTTLNLVLFGMEEELLQESNEVACLILLEPGHWARLGKCTDMYCLSHSYQAS